MDPDRGHRRLAPRMCELDADLLVLGVRECDELGPCGGLCVIPDPCVFRRDAALGEDGGRFDEGEARAAGEDPADCGCGTLSGELWVVRRVARGENTNTVRA